MVCIDNNTANCSKKTQFLPVMCALCLRCARCAYAVPALCTHASPMKAASAAPEDAHKVFRREGRP